MQIRQNEFNTACADFESKVSTESIAEAPVRARALMSCSTNKTQTVACQTRLPAKRACRKWALLVLSQVCFQTQLPEAVQTACHGTSKARLIGQK